MSAKDLEKYQFRQGVSGNALGRPKGRKDNATIFKEILIAKDLEETDPTRYLFNKLVEILEDKNQNPTIVRQTANNILDRLFGKPKSTIEHGRTPEDLAFAGQVVTNLLLGKEVTTDDFLEAEEAEVIEE